MKELRREQDATTEIELKGISFKKARGWLLFAIGWLLSPLCWWNDLIFNLPVAYGFGYLCSLFSSSWMLPGTIVGYWFSNLIGILLMQAGAIDVFQSQERNLKKELFWGVVSSSIFTIVVVALIQLKVLDLPVDLLVRGQ
ncbi:hypothetical protein [Leptolyngbya sp. NIES-2104]|uniref:hypothetical protein n=1 Tax=Leptolyngbya sp. NIES-2104 TaxID=1552121 RepID=UPI00073E5FC0|nr:hypothetical protein [Leptolyngbya sp. NIES-2104]